MILNTNTEKIEIILRNNITQYQADFVSSYIIFQNDSATIFESNGTTNGTSAVTVMDSPASGTQRQLRTFVMNNEDTSSGMTIIVRYNDNNSTYRNIFRAFLNSGDRLQYHVENGWNIYNSYGEKVVDSNNQYPSASIRFPELMTLPSVAVSITPGANIAMMSMGKADASYSSITIAYNVTTLAATITWCEMAIYKVAQPMGVGTQQITRRCGVISTASIWNSTGLKYTNIPVSDINKGDDLYLIMGNVATTSAAFRGSGVADNLSSILNCINNAASTWRPSTTENMTASSFSNAIASIVFAWQGFSPTI